MSDMMSSADAPRSPGRPRSLRADEAIIEATLDLLAEGSTIEALSIEAIASRAGVGKATIYRRWSGKEALLRDALGILKGTPPETTGRSVREDLIVLVGGVGRNADPRASKIMPCLIPEVNRDPDRYQLYQSIIEPRRARVREVLRRGVSTGELRADLDIELALAMLTGPMLIQRVLRWHPELDDTVLPERVVDGVLEGIRAR
ncbi:TetR/AcrR family transcriptional regulator [Micromonospora sp. WMMD812]|uniref:TetR/AcrR family transcriptional regulator n=1 Tax=Micromonospora sp. WMMD812 TaxID=3015152 RepID=UPI00248D1E90|nr:TetR/AcrR family transcriptional regulator [Micromonospora sp. WMMD812]WBB69727.1 TetR/AcrR family transcriptional regulator [Micromonospora sp. WMMD812]